LCIYQTAVQTETINLLMEYKVAESTSHEYLEVVHECASARFHFVDAQREQALAQEGQHCHQNQQQQFQKRRDTRGLRLNLDRGI
jgi:hypothetical protein